MEQLGEVSVGMGPEAVVLDPERRRGYVACPRSDSVCVFDMDSHATIGSVAVGREPIAMVLDPMADRGYTVDARSGSLTCFDTGTFEVIDRAVPCWTARRTG